MVSVPEDCFYLSKWCRPLSVAFNLGLYCLATGPHSTVITSLTEDPGPGWSHSSVEIGHEIISTIILLLLIQEGLLSVTRESMCTKYWLTAISSLPRKKNVVR